MRETLTALAILLIVALTAALAGPYFVDWNANRGFLESKLSRALGQKVTIGGGIDLKLLPTPYLVLNQAVIGGDDGPIRLGIRHLDLELAVAPLLHGQFEIVEAQLAEPTIRITLGHDRTLPPLSAAPVFDADVRFDRITLSDGTLAIADPDSGRTFALEHIDLEAEAEALAGPFRGSGAAGQGGARTKFRFATAAAAQNGRAHAKLAVEETPTHPSLDFDGMVSLARASDASLAPGLEGTAIVAGHLRGRAADPLPWRLSAALRATPREAQWATGELRLGGEDHSLLLAAAGRARFGPAPDLHLDLVGKQLDLDRLTARSDAADPAAPLPLSDMLALGRALRPPLPTSVDLSVATATLGGAALGQVDAAFTLGAPGASPLRLSLDAPGGAHFDMDGMTDGSRGGSAPGQGFSGRVALAAPDVPVLRAWLGRVAPDLAIPPVPVQALDARAEVAADAGGLDLRALALRLDRSAITGGARVMPASGTRPALVKADLRAEALDLETLPDLPALRSAAAGVDLDLRFEARGVKVARVGGSPLDAGRIRLALVKQAGRFALDALRIEALGGATLEASAALDAAGGHVDATLTAGHLADLAALAQRVAPGAWSEAFASRAAALAPAQLTLAATLPPLDAPDGLAPRRLTVAGTLGATRLTAALAPDPADDRKIVATVSAEAPEGGALLRQVGLPVLPVVGLGPGRVTAEAKGAPGGALATSVEASVGATRLDLAGHLTLGEGGSAAGSAKLASPDGSPLLQALVIAFPDLMGRLPATLEGQVSWTPAAMAVTDLRGTLAGGALGGTLTWRGGARPERALSGSLSLERLSLPTLLSLVLGPVQQPATGAPWTATGFGVGLIDPPTSSLDLAVRSLDLGRGLVGSDATLGLAVSPGSVALRGLRARFRGGTIAGDLTVRRDGGNAVLEGSVAADGAGVALPSITGRLSGRLTLAGSGRTALALASSLSGSGEATLDAFRVARADPAALPKVFDEVEADHLSVDEESILRALDEAQTSPLAAESQAFAVSLAAGILHAEPKPSSDPAAGATRTAVSLAADLGRLTLDARVEEILQALPKDWSGAPPALVVRLAGPVLAPIRTLDAGAFVNALAGRALARETARIEAFEADARERAFFNARLQADRRREQDRLKAEEDARAAAEAARKAEAERRAREAATRFERARKAEEARAAERAAQEKAARERSEQQARDPVPGPSSYQPPAASDPSAAGR